MADRTSTVVPGSVILCQPFPSAVSCQGFGFSWVCSRGPWRCCLTTFTHDMLIGEILSSPTGEGDALFGAPQPGSDAALPQSMPVQSHASGPFQRIHSPFPRKPGGGREEVLHLGNVSLSLSQHSAASYYLSLGE